MRSLIAGCVLLTLAGCATTTTVLLPDEDGKVGALVLKHGDETQIVDQAYTEASVGRIGGAMHTRGLSQQEVERKYGAVLAAQPMAPASYILYFQEGGVELTDESSGQLAAMIEVYKHHAPAKVFIIGHTDTAGSADLNQRLGLERAQQVERLLRAANPNFESMEVRSFGENDPLVKTGDDVSEPKNRRVEVLIL